VGSHTPRAFWCGCGASHVTTAAPSPLALPVCAAAPAAACQQQRAADIQLAARRLQDLKEEAARRPAQLDSLDALYSERQESLRHTAAELARRRGELSTLESSLSESLRRKADAEFQALEEQLRG
jgi:septal ring factor EnvC (AmiA/AmiB activator)